VNILVISVLTQRRTKQLVRNPEKFLVVLSAVSNYLSDRKYFIQQKDAKTNICPGSN
jgi:hypothetical protein